MIRMLALALLCTLPLSAIAEDDKPLIDGYAGQLSVVAGDALTLHLSSNADSADVTIQRLGAQVENVWTGQDVACSQQPIPARASSDGCNWPATLTVNIPAEWKTGYYRALLEADNGGKGSLFFVVRSSQPGKDTKILLQLATNTYNAYTNWGGHSLYSYHDRDGLQGHRVSFARPLNSQFDKWEQPFVQWAEENGYVLDYAVNNDLEFRPQILKHYRLVLSVGHDEYWSSPMRDQLEQFIADGGNVAFFSGNTCCW